MSCNVRKILSKIWVYLCTVMLLNIASPCISFAVDADIVNIENDTSINEYVHTSSGIVYSKYILDEDKNLSKNLFLNDSCVAEGIIDFCVDNQNVVYSSDNALYLYNTEDGTSNNIYTNVQLRDLILYNNYIYGVNDSEGLSQHYVIDSCNGELIKTNYTNVNAFTVSDDGLNIDMKLSASKLEEIGTDKIDVSTYSAVADAEEVNKSNIGLDNIINNCENNISLFSTENVDMPVLMATVTLSSLQPAMFVMDTLYVTQGAYSSYSHSDDNAFDLDGSLGGGAAANVKAPFDGKIKYKANESAGNCHAVWFESNNIVQYANGNTGYMTVLVMHDDDISNVYEGQAFLQGQIFYQEGSYGLSNVTGQHLHLECINGTAGSYAWHKRGNVYPNDALYLYSNTNIQNKGGYTWRTWDGVIDVKPPSNPTISAIKTNGTQVTVSWGAVSNATSYLCEIRKSEKDFPLACNSVTTSQTSCVVDLTEGGTYYACVYAYNGNVSSGANWHIFGTPGRPKIKNVSTNGEYVTITWDATNYTTRYECKILKAEDGFPWACNPIETTETSCTVMLPEGGTYYALITALNSSGCSGADWYIFGTPERPNISVISTVNRDVTINWNKAAYATSYKLSILKAEDGFPLACDPIETADTNYTLSLPTGGTYYALVNACNKNGSSGTDWYIFGTAGESEINNIATNGKYVTINWKATNNTKKYVCKVMKAETDFPLACEPIETTENSCTFELPTSGTYYAGVISYNSIGQSTSKWEIFAHKLEYKITFDANGGITPTASKTVAYNSTYGELPTPTKAGYKFIGWYTSATDGTQITADSVVQISSAQTLYAQWKKSEPYVESQAYKNRELFSVIPNVYNVEGNHTIIVAGYKNRKLIDFTQTKQSIPATLKGDIDEIKIMVWDSLSGLKPLCEAGVIPSSEFIIE